MIKYQDGSYGIMHPGGGAVFARKPSLRVRAVFFRWVADVFGLRSAVECVMRGEM